MALTQQWQARHWKLSSWDNEHGWDEWYEKVENTMRVQNVEIIGFQEDLRGVKNESVAIFGKCYGKAGALKRPPPSLL